MAEKRPAPPKVLVDGKPVKGILKYPRLNEPDTKFKPTGEFSTKVILDNETGKKLIAVLTPLHEGAFKKEKEALEAKLAEAKGEQKGKLKKAIAALKAGDLPVKPVFDDEGNETDQFEITFKMNAVRKDRKDPTGKKLLPLRPNFFDAKGNPIKFEAAPSVWGGTVARVSGYVSSYYAAAANTAGASLRLSAVQIIDLKTGGGGATAEAHGFGEEEGFEADESAPSTTSTTPSEAPKEGNADGDSADEF